MGVGVSTYVEICAMGPSIALPSGGWRSARPCASSRRAK